MSWNNIANKVKKMLYVYYLILQVYYFHHKNILKTRVICCLTHNFRLTVIWVNCNVLFQETFTIPPPHGDHPHPYNFHSRGCLSYTPCTPPEENIFIKNAVALYFYAEDNCMFSVIKRGKIFLFILKQCLMFSVLPGM